MLWERSFLARIHDRRERSDSGGDPAACGVSPQATMATPLAFDSREVYSPDVRAATRAARTSEIGTQLRRLAETLAPWYGLVLGCKRESCACVVAWVSGSVGQWVSMSVRVSTLTP